MFENIENMIYNNVDFDDKFNNGDDDYFIINDVKGRGEYSENLSTIRVTGLDGVIIGGQQASEQYIEIHFTLKSPSYDSLHKKLETLLDTLYSEEDVPITFSDENGRTYFGRFREIVRSYEGSKIFKGIIYILRADPYKYGEEKTANFESDTVIVENQGTAPADPIFELEVNEPTTFAMVSNGEEYMMVGRPVDVDEIPTNKHPRVLHNNTDSLTGWTNMTQGYVLEDSITGGIVGGTMASTGFSFVADSYGTNPNGWVGPAVRTSLSKEVQDFVFNLELRNFNLSGGIGKMSAFLLDASDNIVASMTLMNQTSRANNRIVFRLGHSQRVIFDYTGDRPGVWNNKRVWLKFIREGQRFYAQAFNKLDDGTLTGRHSQTYIDSSNEFQGEVAQVVLYIAKAKDFPVFDQHIHGVNMFEVLSLDDLQVPYIAEAGDNIKFDHQTGDCYINGEPVPFDFGGDFFKLRKGYNTLAVMPENTFNTSVKYRERYR